MSIAIILALPARQAASDLDGKPPLSPRLPSTLGFEQSTEVGCG